ncbi:MAG: efflux RND transporter periplasmic adaptor subunit [Candidatus Riflebacteria bacterium]|nr:efflux RND transporter periplasmic adaptor subunit [Candidatus Riflebacteria bacterium]
MAGPGRQALVGALILAALCLAIRFRHGTEPPFRRVKVRAHPLRQSIAVQGVLKATSAYRAHSPLDATLVRLVPEGSRVAKGGFVAQLDARERAEKVREQTFNRETARLELAIKELEFEQEVFEVGNRVASAKHELQVARLSNELVDRGIDYAELVRLTHSLKASEATRQNLLKALREALPYSTRGFVSSEEVETLRLKEACEKLTTESLSVDREILTSGATTDKRAEARKSVAIAEKNLENAMLKERTFHQRREQGLAEVKARLASAAEEVSQVGRQLEQATIRSPVDGVVLYELVPVEGPGDDQRAREGMRLSYGAPFCQVVRPGRVHVEMEIDEADAPRVKVGQQVSFQLDAYPGSVFKGRLSKLKPAISGTLLSRWFFPTVHSLTAEAQVDDPDSRLYPEMTAYTEILLEERSRALWLDVAAVDQDEVLLPDGTRRRIGIGYVKEQEVEVTAGLSEGDEVLVPQESPPEPPPGQAAVRVAARDLVITLSDHGSLVATNECEIFIPELEGEQTLQSMATDGTSVTRGQVIAQLDSEILKEKLKARSLELSVAEKDEKVVAEQASADLDSLSRSLEVAELSRQVAELDLTVLLSGKRPREIKDLAGDLESAEADIGFVRRKLSIQGSLARRGFAKQKDTNDLTLDLLNRETALEVARAKFELARQGATELERQKARGTLSKAELDLQLARKKVAVRAKKRELELAKSAIAVKKARTAADRIRRMIGSCTVRAPAAGTVTRNERWANDGLRKYQEGDQVGEGQVFIKVSNLDHFKIVGTIPEERVTSVAVGQRARFALTSFPTESYEGRVRSVGRVAREKDGSWRSDDDSRIFDVEIETTAHRKRFQPGLSVSFAIEIQGFDRCLVIPTRSLHYDSEGAFVFLPSGARRRITVGEEQSGVVRVIAGLTRDDEVLAPREDLQGSQGVGHP